jgi:NAD-dependent SIR2 family protein deacetylase
MEEKEVAVKHKYIPWPDYNCPNCDYEITNPYFKNGYMPKYCPECGQKIIKPSIQYPL